ncbi:hypothetical protein P12x_001261 [Tundrisphaera lichenicola]|uniref:hypothetical protein n=1 Tax=Tundrisphaera lichenicola TaxID=2029860 RepID=UPI003EBAA0AF
MRGFTKAFLTFGLVAAMAGVASAQGRGGFGGGFGGGPGLVAIPAVQKELKLDDSQVEKAQEVIAEMRDKGQEMRSSLEGLEGEERMKKMQELMKANNEAAHKSLSAILKPEQVARLKQIELQQQGANAITDADVAKKLGITAEQKEKAQTILADSREEMREAFQSAGDDRQAAMAKIQTLRKETNSKVMALMTEDQKKTWKEMTGEPFEVPPGGPRGR